MTLPFISARVAVAFLVGTIAGAGTVEALRVFRADRRNTLFEQRLKCKKLAEEYVKSNTDDQASVFLDRVDFSPTRSSCVASTAKAGSITWDYEVVDVVTGDVLSSGTCSKNQSKSSSFCGNGKDMSLIEKRDKAFDEAVR